LAIDGTKIAAHARRGMYTAEELKEALGREAVSNLGRKPEAVVADKGYQSAEMLEAMEAEELNAHVAQPKVQTTQGYGHEAFAYDAERDEYFCPGGARPSFWKTKRLRQTLYRVYRADRARPGHSLQPNDFRDRLALAGCCGEDDVSPVLLSPPPSASRPRAAARCPPSGPSPAGPSAPSPPSCCPRLPFRDPASRPAFPSSGRW
jgi:hypothetical protein